MKYKLVDSSGKINLYDLQINKGFELRTNVSESYEMRLCPIGENVPRYTFYETTKLELNEWNVKSKSVKDYIIESGVQINQQEFDEQIEIWEKQKMQNTKFVGASDADDYGSVRASEIDSY